MSHDYTDLIARLRAKCWFDAADAIAALVAERDAAVADAQRYRWLRENCAAWSWSPCASYPGKIVGFSHNGTGYCDYTLDAALDAAIASTSTPL